MSSSAKVLLNIPDYEYAAAKTAQTKAIEILRWPERNANKIAAIAISKDKGKLAVSVYIDDAAPGGRPVLPPTIMNIPVRMFSGGKDRAQKEAIDVRVAGNASSNRQKMMQDVKHVATSLSSKFHAKPGFVWPPSFKISNDNIVIVDSVPANEDSSYVIRVRVIGKDSTQLPLYENTTVISQINPASLIEQFIRTVSQEIDQFKPKPLVV